MPHIVRFSIFRQSDIDLSLSICKRLNITPEDFARSAFFEAIEGAAHAISERERVAKENAEYAAEQEKEKANVESASTNTSGTSTTVQLGEGLTSDPLAEEEELTAQSASGSESGPG